MKTVEKFYPRGVGVDSVPDMLTGDTEHKLRTNMSCFVDGKKSGEIVVKEIFGDMARLDYRESEPNWIQVKFGSDHENAEKFLNTLRKLILWNGSTISKEIVEQAKFMENIA